MVAGRIWRRAAVTSYPRHFGRHVLVTLGLSHSPLTAAPRVSIHAAATDTCVPQKEVQCQPSC
jgi:hypothetical protein